MNVTRYPEIKAGRKRIKRLYLAIMLWTVGKGIQAAAKVDEEVQQTFAKLPPDFTLRLMIMPESAFPLFFYAKMLPRFILDKGLLFYGTQMIIHKDKDGKIHYQGSDPQGKKFGLSMAFKHLEGAMMVFTFRESTPTAYAHDRFVVEGYLPHATAVMRILDIVQIYLLPKPIARLAVKRYPEWSEMSPLRKHINRIVIYVRAFTTG